MDESDFGNPTAPSVELTEMEAFQFLFTNWMPHEVITDMICDHPDIVKPLVGRYLSYFPISRDKTLPNVG